jgi:plastocyanin
MKKFIGLFILLIAFIAFMGCTQPAVQQPTTTVPTTIPTTIPTMVTTTNVSTPLPTTVLTTVATSAIPTATRTTSPSGKVVTTIHIRNNAFVPSNLTVLPGTGVTWINDDDKVQSVKAIGNFTGQFNSGDILPGAQWSYTFGRSEATIQFTSSYHPDMLGTVIVKAPNSGLSSY